MTNDKTSGTTDTDTDKSANHKESDDSTMQMSVTTADSPQTPVIDSQVKTDASQELSSLETEDDSRASRSLCAVTKHHMESSNADTNSTINDITSSNEAEVFSSSAPLDDSTGYLSSAIHRGAACSSDTIDSGICRSSRSLERSGSLFEQEDTVPELHNYQQQQHHLQQQQKQQQSLGSDYNYDFRRPSNSTIESLSDDEIEENYLGNIPAHKRRSGVFVYPIQEAEDSTRSVNADECESYIGVKRVRQDTSSVANYDHADENMSFGVKRIYLKTEQNGHTSAIAKARSERWSKGSMDSAGSKAESSVSFSDTLATHVRKDSIAIGLEKMLVSYPSRRRSSVSFADVESLINKVKMHKSKKDLLIEFRLHLFVALIFLVTVSFVSIGWFFHNKTVQALVVSQKIFFDPRSRKLTLHSHVDGDEVTGYIGLNIPRWQLPLHCPIREEGNPNAKECIWKKNAILRIGYFKEKSIQCYNISWEYLNPNTVPLDCFEIGNSVWFGSSNLTSNLLPIVGNFSFDPNTYRIKENGVLSHAVEYYWLSSSSHAILVHSDIPVYISWNNTQAGRMCLISNYSSPFYARSENGIPPFNYTVCNGHDMIETHKFMRKMFASNSRVSTVDADLLLHPWWSVGHDISQKEVIRLALDIKSHKLNCSALHVDGQWQTKEGDLDFDLSRFPNTTEMLSLVQAAKCNISLSVSPYFDYGSLNFKEGMDNDYFVKDAGGDVPGLTRHISGMKTVLDVTTPMARQWYARKLARMSSTYGINTFSFSYGNGSWLPHYPHFEEKQMSPNRLRKMFSEMLASVGNKLSMQMTSQSQDVHAFLPIPSVITVRFNRACISNSITAALTTGLLGYPYVFSDGFQYNKDVDEDTGSAIPSREIYIRWLQLSAFFPAMKYSVAPWLYDVVTLEVARNVSILHRELVVPIIKDYIKREIKDGLPILRPVWWLSPGNRTALGISDQFLVGDHLLVAPILCEGQTSRDIFFPKGIWADEAKRSLTVGPRLIRNYTVGQFDVPYFVRMKVAHE